MVVQQVTAPSFHAHSVSVFATALVCRPTQKLPTLYVYNESLTSRERPGLLDLKGKWKSSYIEVGTHGFLGGCGGCLDRGGFEGVCG